MSLHFSRKSKELLPKVSIKEKLESKDESHQALTKYKISLFARKFKNFMNFKRKLTLKMTLRNGRRISLQRKKRKHHSNPIKLDIITLVEKGILLLIGLV